MILDNQLVLSSAQVITTGAANSTNVIDQGVVGISRAYPSMGYAIVRCNTAFVGGTTLQIQLVSSAAAALTSPVVHYDSGAVATASLTGLNTEMVKVPMPLNALEFIGFIYTAAGTYTTGKVDAYIVTDARFPEYAASGGQ